ncbi:MAG: polyribonucleotide nucleotidyltransferase [Planctomycetota bacterium]|nr:polyribonucleotide nucleotidyltransferase [Planctomycetota bacterium]
MFVKKTTEIDGRSLSIEVGRMARLAPGAAVVRLEDTIVLCTACEADPRPGIDFFPLTIDYREKTYAAGKIPGGFFKREGRPTGKEILSCRLIDRPLRPLFSEGYKNEVQVLCNVLSYDGENEMDVLAGIGSSMALMLSDMPLLGPLAWVRVGRVDGKLVAFPTESQREQSDIDLIVAGTKHAVTMVEAGMNCVSEKDALDAIDVGHEMIKRICALQEEVMAELGVTPAHETYTAPEDPNAALAPLLREKYYQRIHDGIIADSKQKRALFLKGVRDEAVEEFGDLEETKAEGKWPLKAVKMGIRDLSDVALRSLIMEGKRVDGRGPKDIREITSEVALLPRAHGSALFTRGETQALVSATLGTSRDEAIIDGLKDEYRENFLLHYNFPPSSVGEVRPMRGTSRREVGHGNLAERALKPVVPLGEDFPYTLRIVSDVLMSNGSSSMATVCGSSLALMDAGVQVSAPVAGIAMGLVQENGKHVVLSDILGDEDHSGDMDFKVAGTREGINALQMDIKATGLSREILEAALEQAREGRLHILDCMNKVIDTPRDDYSPFAPRVTVIKINPEKIGGIIGPGGKIIRQIQEETGTTIEVVNDGTVKIFATEGEGAQKAREWIEGLVEEAEIGRDYEGPIVSMLDFGVFVQITPNLDGLVHVSELDDSYVERPQDVVKMGEVLKVKCIDVDPTSGKVKLSRKAVIMEERGETYVPAPRGGRGGRDRGGRDRGRGRGGRDRERTGGRDRR